jgi:hypothetical protein
MHWDQLLAKAAPEGHLVQFYQADKRLLSRNVSHYLWEGLKLGHGLLVVAMTEHAAEIALELKGLGADTEAAVRDGRLVFSDAEKMLASFMVDGQPDWGRFESIIGGAMLKARAQSGNKGLRVYGEMVGILWMEGRRSSAMRLEQFWNKLIKSIASSVFCAHPIDVFGKDFQIAEVDDLLCAHTQLLPSAIDRDLESSVNLAMDEVLGPRADRLRPLIKANYRPSWAAMPRGEAVILWLRSNLPDRADEILSRARQLYRMCQGTATMHNETS